MCDAPADRLSSYPQLWCARCTQMIMPIKDLHANPVPETAAIPTDIERPPAMRPRSEQPFDPMPSEVPSAPNASTLKVAALDPFRDRPRGAVLTTDQGLPLSR